MYKWISLFDNNNIDNIKIEKWEGKYPKNRLTYVSKILDGNVWEKLKMKYNL